MIPWKTAERFLTETGQYLIGAGEEGSSNSQLSFFLLSIPVFPIKIVSSHWKVDLKQPASGSTCWSICQTVGLNSRPWFWCWTLSNNSPTCQLPKLSKVSTIVLFLILSQNKQITLHLIALCFRKRVVIVVKIRQQCESYVSVVWCKYEQTNKPQD